MLKLQKIDLLCLLNMKETINLLTEGSIWRILFDDYGQFILLETRNSNTKKASLKLIDLQIGNHKNLAINLEDNWWFGISRFQYPFILLYKYPEPTIPESKGIICFNCNENKIIWEREDLQYFDDYQANFTAIDWKTKQRLKLDLNNGRTAIINSKVSENPIDQFLRKYLWNPEVYQEESSGYVNIAEFIKKKLDLVVVKAIEYLEFTQYIIISFYIYGHNNLVLYNTLVVYSLDGKLLLKEDLAVGKKGIGLNTFTVFNSFLVFIKNTNQIAIYELG